MISSLGDRNPMQHWPFCQGPEKRSLYKCDTWIGINLEDICFLLPVSCLIKKQVIFTTAESCRFVKYHCPLYTALLAFISENLPRFFDVELLPLRLLLIAERDNAGFL